MNQTPKTKLIIQLTFIFLAAALLILLDQWTKQLAETLLVPGQIKVLLNFGPLGDVCQLQLVRNSGAFLSLGAGLVGGMRPILMIVVPLVALAAILFVLLQPFWKPTAKPVPLSIKIALGLILAGGSNIIDRIFRGEVTDFLNFGISSLRTGIMNIADLYIAAAIVVLLIATLRSRKAPTKDPAQP